MKKTPRTILSLRMLAVLAALLLSLACSSSGGGGTEECPDGTKPLDGSCVPITDGDGVTDGDLPVDGDRIPDGDTPIDGDMEPDGDLDRDTVADGDGADGDLEPDREPEYAELEFDYTQTNCDFNPSSTIPEIKVTPNTADFGAVVVGDSNQVVLEVCNAGGADLALTSIQFGQGTSWEFVRYHDDLPLTIPPGKASPIYVLYIPNDTQSDTGSLMILSDDANRPVVNIPLLSSIKPTPIMEFDPPVVKFVGTTPGETSSTQVELRNVGLSRAQVQSLTLGLGDNSPYTVGDVIVVGDDNPSGPPWSLGRGDTLIATIFLDMGDESIDDTLVATYTWDSFERTASAKLTSSNLADCATPDAGPDKVVAPLDVVYLDGSNSRDDNGVILGYKWEWISKPNGADEAIIKNQAGEPIQGIFTMEPYPNFFAVLAGNYEIKLTLKDSDDGCTGFKEDTVTIAAIPDETIHIQLLWSDPLNDFDLHLIKPGGTHSRNCGAEANSTDCCWSNCATQNGTATPCPLRGGQPVCPGPENAPNWGAADSREDDPTLDIDDRGGTDEHPSRGPENINMSLPAVGDYLISVENYDGSDTALVIVRIYLFGALRTTFQYGPPFSGETGIPKHYHWNVAWLRVNNATDIEIIPIQDSIEFSPDPPTTRGQSVYKK